MKVIELTQGYVTVVDDDDYPVLMRYRWKVLKSGGKFYACRRDTPTNQTILMHRVIAEAQWNELVDHEDGDGLNNVRSNLRRCTQAQNQVNSPARKGGTSQYKGVSWHTRDCRWIAQLGNDSSRKYLGRFNTEEDAARAYDRAAKERHGVFAVLNFPGQE